MSPIINPSGGGGGGSQPFKDLGTVTAADLVSGGPQTLYTPAAGECVLLMFPSGVSVDNGQISFGPFSDDPDGVGIYWAHVSTSQDALFNAGKDTVPGTASYFPNGPIVARWGLNYAADGFVLRSAAGARQQTHAYAIGQGILLGGVVYVCSVAGTSAGSAPVFDSAPGNPTADGGVTWLSNGAPPAVGGVHVVALTGVPISP